MLKKILLAILGLLLVIFIIGLFQSDEMKVSRSAVIAAKPDIVYGIVNDFHQWDHWSPWSKLDPAMKVTFEGPGSGVGATYHWSGNSEVGEGTTRLVESVPNEKIKMRLECERPFRTGNDVIFSFSPEGEGTRVTWAMEAKKPFVGKIVGLFIDCDKICGDAFEKGLASLNQYAAKKP